MFTMIGASICTIVNIKEQWLLTIDNNNKQNPTLFSTWKLKLNSQNSWVEIDYLLIYPKIQKKKLFSKWKLYH